MGTTPPVELADHTIVEAEGAPAHEADKPVLAAAAKGRINSEPRTDTTKRRSFISLLYTFIINPSAIQCTAENGNRTTITQTGKEAEYYNGKKVPEMLRRKHATMGTYDQNFKVPEGSSIQRIF